MQKVFERVFPDWDKNSHRTRFNWSFTGTIKKRSYLDRTGAEKTWSRISLELTEVQNLFQLD